MELESTQMVLEYDDKVPEKEDVVGRLVVEGQQHLVMAGDCRVGRDPKSEVVVEREGISLVHAVIEAEWGGAVIYDARSSYGTMKGSLKLKPEVRYALQSGDRLTFGAVSAYWLDGPEPATQEAKLRENIWIVMETDKGMNFFVLG